MALRKIRVKGDEILRKRSREVNRINERILTILDDMVETMHNEDGVGLAAPQVGILKRLVVIDIGEKPIKMINPEILSEEGEQIDEEGCLSVPNVRGLVKRPKEITVKYYDKKGTVREMVAKDLLARCICHEVDHLNGILFIDKTMK